MTILHCPKCDADVEITDPFAILAKNGEVVCPECHARLLLDYDSFYDEESGECDGYFALHLRESS